MTSHALPSASNDAQFVIFPLNRPSPQLSLIPAPVATPPAQPRLEFTIAEGDSDLDAALALVGRCYGWRGYQVEQPVSAAGEITLLARWHGQVVGTVTVRCGRRVRLHAETGFAEHVDALRRQGCRLVEYTRFAINRDVLASIGHEVNLALELIRRAFLLGRISMNATDCLIEVNPRHARYYQQAFGFRPFGREQPCERVGAPARLLHLNLAQPSGRIPLLDGGALH
jgi:hypothetical protein